MHNVTKFIVLVALAALTTAGCGDSSADSDPGRFDDDGGVDGPEACFCEVAFGADVYELPCGAQMCVEQGVATCSSVGGAHVNLSAGQKCSLLSPVEPWYGHCEGTRNTSYCSTQTPSTCYRVPGCELTTTIIGPVIFEDCIGLPTTCTQITSEAGCDYSNGCSWVGGVDFDVPDMKQTHRADDFDCDADNAACFECAPANKYCTPHADGVCGDVVAALDECDLMFGEGGLDQCLASVDGTLEGYEACAAEFEAYYACMADVACWEFQSDAPCANELNLAAACGTSI